MKCDDLPPHLALLLEEVGVINPKSEPQPIVRDLSFKRPELDENGEPPW